MNSIGDAIMSQPAWRSIKGDSKGIEIDLICKPHIAPLFFHDPAIENIYTFERQKYFNWLFKEPRKVKKLIDDRNYDLIIDFSALPLTAIFCAENSIIPSIGFQRNVKAGNRLIDIGEAYNYTVKFSETANIRLLMIKLAELALNKKIAMTKPVFIPNKKVIAKAYRVLDKLNLKEKGFFVLHPGAKWAPKRWPDKYCKNFLKLAVAKFSAPWVILGSNDDVDRIKNIIKDLKLSAIHPLIIEEIDVSSAIISMAKLCVCNDSAAMHIAAAVGIPSISIFGPVSPQRSAPSEHEECWVMYKNFFCSPCPLYFSKDRCKRGLNFCMYAVTPSIVFNKLENIINQST